MDHLANELLCDIFKQLNVDNVNKCTNVCKQWKNIIYGNIEYLVEHYALLKKIQKQIQNKIVDLSEFQEIMHDMMSSIYNKDYYKDSGCCYMVNNGEPFNKLEYVCPKHKFVFCEEHYYICDNCGGCQCEYSASDPAGCYDYSKKCNKCNNRFCCECLKTHVCGEQKYKIKKGSYIKCESCYVVKIKTDKCIICEKCEHHGWCEKCTRAFGKSLCWLCKD